MGQKRRVAKMFREVLRQFDAATTFVDLFGGSGLLSHITKRERPDARVIYNDYDDYHVRIQNIERTNALRVEIADLIGRGYLKQAKLPVEKKAAILELIADHARAGFVDYVTVSSWLLFSLHYATSPQEFENEGFYNCIKQTPYNADGYLDGLEIVKYDYRELFNRYKDLPEVVFLVDPPYLSTMTGHYQNNWRLNDYLDVPQILVGQAYIYFTSDKSSIVDLMEWLQKIRCAKILSRAQSVTRWMQQST